MDAAGAVALINSQPHLKTGSIRFWGNWFGKPFDNLHRITGCRSSGEILVMEFDGGEKLTVRKPDGLEVGPDTFAIQSAAVIRWEWFYYGRPKTPENLYYFNYVRSDSGIQASTNVDWYQPDLSPSINEKAVEIL